MIQNGIAAALMGGFALGVVACFVLFAFTR